MKKFFSFLAAAAMLFTASCSNDDLGNDEGGDALVSFSMNLDGVSSTKADIGKGTLVDQLQYAVFEIKKNANGEDTYTFLHKYDTKNVPTWPAQVDIRLAKNKSYRVVFWAQDTDCKAYTVTDDMNVTVNYEGINNDETRDAFFGHADLTNVSGSIKQDVTLYRPFAQLNVGVIAEDWQGALNSGVEMTHSTVTVNKVANTINLVNGEIGANNTSVTYTVAQRPNEMLYVDITDDGVENFNEFYYLSMSYLLVEQDNVSADFKFSTAETNGHEISLNIPTVPVQRNHRTNILGQILTGNVTFEIKIDADFDGDIDAANPKPVEVTTAEELAAALRADAWGITVKLANDIDLPISSLGQITGGSGEYKLGGKNTKNITIDLNGKKLNVTTTYWSNLGAKNDDAVFTIKNGTMTSSQATGTWNSYDLTFSNCDYIFEDVVFEKAVAFANAGKNVTLKGVTINETHDYYAMWITAEGQTVTIDGLTVNSNNGRGIKIDEQYVDTPEKVTLNVKNATFNTAKKAAILVKSEAGAEINWGTGNSIANVAADKKFAVWVDEDAAAHADKVIVNGAYKAVENVPSDIIANPSELASATIKDGSTIYLVAAGDYAIPAAAKGKTLTIKGTEDVAITVNKPNLDGGNLTLDGVTVKASGKYTGVQHVNTVTYNNAKIVGEMCLYGEKVVFNGCEFVLSAGQYIWTYGAKEVEFIGCTFNTAGKAILVYNEGAGANRVTVKNCTFKATEGAKAGAIANQNCAAIEIDNYQNSGTGVAHTVITEGNTYENNFSGEWRIKNFVAGNAVVVNGKSYTQIAIDGKLMTKDASNNVTLQ